MEEEGEDTPAKRRKTTSNSEEGTNSSAKGSKGKAKDAREGYDIWTSDLEEAFYEGELVDEFSTFRD